MSKSKGWQLMMLSTPSTITSLNPYWSASRIWRLVFWRHILWSVQLARRWYRTSNIWHHWREFSLNICFESGWVRMAWPQSHWHCRKPWFSAAVVATPSGYNWKGQLSKGGLRDQSCPPKDLLMLWEWLLQPWRE